MKLHNFLNIIFDIAEANNVDYGVGMDMFLANIRNQRDKRLPWYKGADQLDYTELKDRLSELQQSKTEFSTAVHKNYDEIVALHKEGKRVETVKLVLKYDEV